MLTAVARGKEQQQKKKTAWTNQQCITGQAKVNVKVRQWHLYILSQQAKVSSMWAHGHAAAAAA